MKLLVAGATGTVGRELSRRAVAAGHEVVAMSRNQVLLDVLAATVGCEARRLDLLADATALPEADVLVDLTWPNRRLPRQVVGAAEGAVGAVDRWLDRNPRSVAVHACTFVVAGPGRSAPDALLSRLVRDDPYALAKSAGERAVGRARHRDRISVVRLGNVLTDDSAWGTLVLRSLAYGAVANPDALDLPANLCTVRPLLDAAEHPSPLVHATAAAGVPWRTVLATTATLAGARFETAPEPPFRPPESPTPVARQGLSDRLARLARQALWLAPAGLSEVRPWQVWPLLGPARAVQRSVTGFPATGAVAPPTLPVTVPMPAGGQDLRELEAALASLADAYRTRGWAQPTRTR